MGCKELRGTDHIKNDSFVDKWVFLIRAACKDYRCLSCSSCNESGLAKILSMGAEMLVRELLLGSFFDFHSWVASDTC